MTPIEALERFCRFTDRETCELTIRAHGSDADLWPEAMTAAVSLSGMLDDAKTDEELIEGLRHFVALLEAGVFTDEQWVDEANEVIAAVSEVAVPFGRTGRHLK